MGSKFSKKKRDRKRKGRKAKKERKESKMDVPSETVDMNKKIAQRTRRHFVEVQLEGTTYHLDDRYTLKNVLGNGAYGNVAAAHDKLTGKMVAIKRVDRLLDDETDAKRILREIKILRHVKHANIVNLMDFFIEPKEDFNVVYIVFELMQSDLRKIIQSRNVLEKIHMQFIMYQLLCGLKYLHSAKVWHRDLKPANLLLNANSELKICDFGLSRGVDANIEVTDYVVTRWYRAPEIMVCDSYDEKIDIWSAGCILAELHGRKPVFRGADSRDQVAEYLKVLGAQSKEDLIFITNKHAKKFVQDFGKDLKEPENKLPRIYAHIDKDALDLMIKMLEFNPLKRISVEDAIEHPFFADVRKKHRESSCQVSFDFSFEKHLKSIADLRKEFVLENDRYDPAKQ